MPAFFLYSNIFLFAFARCSNKNIPLEILSCFSISIFFQTNYIALSALAQWRTLCTFSCSFENLLFLC